MARDGTVFVLSSLVFLAAYGVFILLVAVGITGRAAGFPHVLLNVPVAVVGGAAGVHLLRRISDGRVRGVDAGPVGMSCGAYVTMLGWAGTIIGNGLVDLLRFPEQGVPEVAGGVLGGLFITLPLLMFALPFGAGAGMLLSRLLFRYAASS